MAGERSSARGTFANGMDWWSWGDGPRTLLFIQGGPGSSIPQGLFARLSQAWFDPFVEDGYTIWMVTRRRHMPEGLTVADIAEDYAAMITAELEGRVDLLVGESYGGMIGQYLAARHGGLFGQVALVVAAARVSGPGKAIDARFAAAAARGDRVGAGMAFAEYVLPGERRRWIRRIVGPWVVRGLLSGRSYPVSDLVVEAESELSFDARAELPTIEVPVVLLCGDRDQFFPPDVVAETASLIPACALVTYPGKGHVKVASSRQVAKDILAFVHGR
jgi:pimeloyl-ACP methyl ester carboxylesterase